MTRLGDLLNRHLIDRLESLTIALAWANAEMDPPGASTPPEQLAELASEGERRRARMLAGLQLLGEYSLFTVAAVADVNNGSTRASMPLSEVSTVAALGRMTALACRRPMSVDAHALSARTFCTRPLRVVCRTAAWQRVDIDCLLSAGTSTVSEESGYRNLAVSARSGIYRRAL